MVEVRTGIHIRTGQPAAADALDRWLADHKVQTTAFADVYEACVHLLREYEDIPDVVAIGTDWLAADELAIVRYARETWPRAIIVLCGAAAGAALDTSPLTVACRSDAALQELLAETPLHLLERLCARAAAIPEEIPPPVVSVPAASVPQLPRLRAASPVSPAVVPRPAGGRADPTADAKLRPATTEAPGSILTAEELSALLDAPDRG